MPLIITGGYLYRLHYEMLSGCKDTAVALALDDEKKYIETQLMPSIDSLSLSGKIQILTWSDLCQTAEFEKSRFEIQCFYNGNLQFKRQIDQMAEQFINKQLERGEIKISKKAAVDCSIEFLLEETAMFNLLINDGYQVDIYPGRHVAALNDIGLHIPDAPMGLKNRIVIELTIHRVGSSLKTAENTLSLSEKKDRIDCV